MFRVVENIDLFRVVQNTNMFRVIQNTSMFRRVPDMHMFRVAQSINKDTSLTKAQTYNFVPKSKANKNEGEAKTSTKPYYTSCFMTCHLASSKYLNSHIYNSHLQTHKVAEHGERTV